MHKYNETDVTWSSIEKYYDYEKVYWHIGKEGIPRYVLENKNGEKIDIGG